MQMKEVEDRYELDRANIRLYEKEGLLARLVLKMVIENIVWKI